jgi:hypothetical protein
LRTPIDAYASLDVDEEPEPRIEAEPREPTLLRQALDRDHP